MGRTMMNSRGRKRSLPPPPPPLLLLTLLFVVTVTTTTTFAFEPVGTFRQQDDIQSVLQDLVTLHKQQTATTPDEYTSYRAPSLRKLKEHIADIHSHHLRARARRLAKEERKLRHLNKNPKVDTYIPAERVMARTIKKLHPAYNVHPDVDPFDEMDELDMDGATENPLMPAFLETQVSIMAHESARLHETPSDMAIVPGFPPIAANLPGQSGGYLLANWETWQGHPQYSPSTGTFQPDPMVFNDIAPSDWFMDHYNHPDASISHLHEQELYAQRFRWSLYPQPGAQLGEAMNQLGDQGSNYTPNK